MGTTPFGPFDLRWAQDGVGPAVLLLHGIYAGAGRHEWSELVPLLREEFSVRAPDLLGFGDSDHPDLEYFDRLLLDMVHVLIEDARTSDGEPPVVVASSLTAAYAVKAIATGARARQLVLITPTGLGSTLAKPPSTRADLAYAIGRHTPVGDVLTWGLTSAASIRWFLTNQAYGDPDLVTDEVVAAHRRSARRGNAKHAVLAFATGRLSLPLSGTDVRLAHPFVIWGKGQRLIPNEEAFAWRALVEFLDVPSGLPQMEAAEDVAAAVITRAAPVPA